MAAVPFTAAIDWDDPTAWYMGDPDLAEEADVRIRHPSGLVLPVHKLVLAQQSRVLKDMFRSLRPPVGGKRKAVDEEGALELETPFNLFSLQEVAHLLRFLYNLDDCEPAHLAAAEAHLPGVVRLAHALDAPKLLTALGRALVSRMRQLEGALQWLPLAEQCQLSAAWDEGVRALAASVLAATAEPNTPAALADLSVATRFQGLAQLGQGTLAAALTAVALTANAASPACRDELAKCVPDVRLLAALRSPGLQEASCTWTVPGFLQLLEHPGPPPAEQRELLSPVFGKGGRWQLYIYPHGSLAQEGVHGVFTSLLFTACLPENARLTMPAKLTVDLIDAAGQPAVSLSQDCCCQAGAMTYGKLRFKRITELRGEHQRLLPGGAITLRASAIWLECEAEAPVG